MAEDFGKGINETRTLEGVRVFMISHVGFDRTIS